MRLGTMMAEATRLTRLGRLAEATALLRGKSQPPSDPATTASSPSPDEQHAVFDLHPPKTPGSAWTAPFSETDTSAAAGDGPDLRRGEPAKPSTDAPDGGRFEDHVYADARGRRAYKLYIPARYDGQALPLIVMLHGCTQTPDDFAAGTRMNELAEAQGFLVAYPAQSKSANASKCWNWFNTADQHRDSGEVGLIAGLTRQILQTHGVDKRRVYVAGLSAGGAAAANVGSAYPDLYAAIGVHSGLACGAARDMPSAFAAMRQGAPSALAARGGVPTIVFHGDKDGTVHAVNGDQVMAQARAGATLNASETLGVSEGGARYRRTIYVNENDLPMFEQWVLHDAGHAWAGGSAKGSYTDPKGPDASGEMVRFLLSHRLATANP